MIDIKYKWFEGSTETARTIQSNAVPRAGEFIRFNAKGRSHSGIVKSVSWDVTENKTLSIVELL